MSELSDWISGIEARLKATAALAGMAILVEDPEDLENQIAAALEKYGMLILIGQPKWRNLKEEGQTAEMLVTSEIAIGEAPSVWRDFPKLLAPASFVESGHDGNWIATYEGLTIGSKYKWVPGANEIAFEGGDESLDALNGPAVFTAAAAEATATSSNAGIFTGELWTVQLKPKCVDVAWTVTKRLQGCKIPGFRYTTIHQGDPLPDKKRQLYQVLAGTKKILGPNRDA